MVGTISIYGIKSPVRCATLGITIAPGHQNRGYGREALLIALRLAFEEYNAHKVELEVYDYNQHAIGLYESVGFVTEGCRREVVYHMGRYFDRILMGILESEWRQRPRHRSCLRRLKPAPSQARPQGLGPGGPC